MMMLKSVMGEACSQRQIAPLLESLHRICVQPGMIYEHDEAPTPAFAFACEIRPPARHPQLHTMTYAKQGLKAINRFLVLRCQ